MDLLGKIWFDIQELTVPALFNIYFAIVSLPLGFVFALLLALGKTSKNKLVRGFCNAYIFAFRGSPIFVQFFLFYSIMLALNPVLWKPWGISWLTMSPLFIGPLALVMNTSAYTAEIFYGALRTVPKGELEAARAFGMSNWQIFKSVTWPNMLRMSWPAYTNEVVFLFLATALIYFTLPVVGAQKDIMSKTRELFEMDYNAFLHYSVAALYFVCISLLIFFVCGKIYDRLMRHVNTKQTKPKLRFNLKLIR